MKNLLLLLLTLLTLTVFAQSKSEALPLPDSLAVKLKEYRKTDVARAEALNAVIMSWFLPKTADWFPKTHTKRASALRLRQIQPQRRGNRRYQRHFRWLGEDRPKAFAQVPEPDGRGCEFVRVFVKILSSLPCIVCFYCQFYDKIDIKKNQFSKKIDFC